MRGLGTGTSEVSWTRICALAKAYMHTTEQRGLPAISYTITSRSLIANRSTVPGAQAANSFVPCPDHSPEGTVLAPCADKDEDMEDLVG